MKGSIKLMEKVNVILTFDDGPHLGDGSANRTQRVLSVLNDHDINAVFFIQYYPGKTVRGKNIVNQAHREGHIIGVHTGMDSADAHADENDHPNRVAAQLLDDDMRQAKSYIRERTGDYPLYVRPPFGRHNAAVRAEYERQGLNMIMWDIESRDAYPGSTEDSINTRIRDEVNRLLNRGDRNLVVLFHDIHPITSQTASLNRFIQTIKDTIDNHEDDLTHDLVHTKDEINDILENY